MPEKNRLSFMRYPVTAAVVVVIVAAISLSLMAAMENWHFIQFTSQIFDTVQYARDTAASQKNFATTPGDDMWGNLLHLGLTQNGAAPLNPWQRELKATVVNSGAIRLETAMPAHDCRRALYYFLNRDSSNIGLLGLDARIPPASSRVEIFPTSSIRVRGINAVEFGCGRDGDALLGMVFQIR